jgi:xanthine dehydrogenase molybdopterin-binding subunit B
VGSASHTYWEDNVTDAFDNDPTSIWSTGRIQEPGVYFQVDLGRVRTFYAIHFQCPIAGDAPAAFDVYLWQSGEPVSPARARVAGFPETSIQFATPQVARYIRLTLVETKIAWWCIAELQVRQ